MKGEPKLSAITTSSGANLYKLLSVGCRSSFFCLSELYWLPISLGRSKFLYMARERKSLLSTFSQKEGYVATGINNQHVYIFEDLFIKTPIPHTHICSGCCWLSKLYGYILICIFNFSFFLIQYRLESIFLFMHIGTYILI